LIDGWTFIAIYIGLVMIYCVDVAYRWTRPIATDRKCVASPERRYEPVAAVQARAEPVGTSRSASLEMSCPTSHAAS
jgi:hypothetical protein